MRIEMVTPGLMVAGMEMLVARLSRGLARRGHIVGITCIEFLGELGEELEREGFRVAVVPTPGVRTVLFPTTLAAWFRQVLPDVVHIHSGAWLKAARAATWAGGPRIVHTIHGLLDKEPPYGPHLKRWAASYTHAVAAVSLPLRDYLVKEARIDPRRVRVVPNGIDTHTFAPGRRSGRVRAAYGLDARSVVIGHVARFSAVKNHALLVEAFAQVARRSPDAFLVLVGEGPLRPAIETMVAELRISDRVGFFGQAGDTPDLYRDFDIFVLPSKAEGTSMSVLEAMATGLPVAATAVGGTPDLLARGEAGLLVPSAEPEALAQALLRLATRPELRIQLGASARDRVLRHYSEEAMFDAYEALYSTDPARAHSVA